MKARKNSKKKPNYLNKVNTSRTDRNRKKYRQVVQKKSMLPLFIFLFFLSILGNVFLIGHYITFDHNKVRVETKTRKVATVSPNYLFLGDSITDFYDLEKYFPDEPVVNSGVGGNMTDDILEDMKNRVYQYNPSKVFLLIGTNDLQDGKTPEEIFDNIKKIVEGIKENRPKAKIYLESITPINHNFERNGAQDRQKEDIEEINEKIKKYCVDENLTYIDLYSTLEDENGNLRAEYTTEGLHLSEEGYDVVTEIIEKYLYE